MTFVYIFFSLYYFVQSADGLYISPCAKWNTTGTTIIGTNSSGNTSDQLNQPQGMHLHKPTNTLYVADTNNRRIQMYSLNPLSSIGITVASNVDSISAIYVDDVDLTIYVALRYENRIEKWMHNSSFGEQIGSQCKQCVGVWVDKNKYMYMSEAGTHTVQSWSSMRNMSTVVAGITDELGIVQERLYFPHGIYLTRSDNTLYIADTMNNRIQKWTNNSENGSTVAGSKDGISGNDNSKLAKPIYVWMDEQSDVLYIVDSENHRIQRWLIGSTVGTTIAGGRGRGSADDQLSVPNSMAFDDFGNLYVCDGKNHRIQMFKMIDNQPCRINHSHSLFTKITMITVATSIFLSWSVLLTVSE